jgi:hypothetical protein
LKEYSLAQGAPPWVFFASKIKKGSRIFWFCVENKTMQEMLRSLVVLAEKMSQSS